MKRILLLIFVVSVFGGTFAQNKNAVKNLRNQKARVLEMPVDGLDLPFVPLKPISTVSQKALTSVPIGTSANVYTLIHDAGSWLNYNSEVNTVSFIHRQGGQWGGTSGNLMTKFSSNFFATKDSTSMLSTSPSLFRYPSGAIYNPVVGNTDPKNAYILYAGPSTGGAGWINNFFGCQKLDGTPGNVVYNALPADTNLLAQYGFTGGNGLFHIMSPAYITGGIGYLYFKINDIKFQADSNIVKHSANYIHQLMKMRTFSNGSNTWSANPNIAFADNGMDGFFYHFGADSVDDPYATCMPNVWKTTDGGVSYTKMPVYKHFDKIPAIIEHIFPTRASWDTIPENWVCRPDFPSGAAGNEGNFPGTVDKYGKLHIAAVIEGRYSNHADSLEFTYANHPIMLFDIFQTDTGWDAVFVDTIATKPVPSDASGYGTGTPVGWDHGIKISKTPDGRKIFITWTDTDISIDSTNIMPEIRSWGYDVDTKFLTQPTTFATGNGNVFFHAASGTAVVESGSIYNIPVSYTDINLANLDPVSPHMHFYLSGVQFTEPEFVVGVEKIKGTGNSSVSQIYPNPVKGMANLNVVLKSNSDIKIVVTNILGQVVYQTVKNNAAVGNHSMSLNTKGWNTGVYFCTVYSGTEKSTRKMIIE